MIRNFYLFLALLCSLTNNILAQEVIDLGLSVNWASINIGARNPQDQGTLCEWNNSIPKQQWGEEWRMPTKNEMQELVQKCTWSASTLDMIPVFKVTGPNGNIIYLPKTGWATYLKEYNYTGERQLTDNGYYWSSTLVQEDKWTMAYALTCQNGNGSISNTYNVDVIKMAIRPVQDKIEHESVDLGLSVEWATMNLGAKKIHETGILYCMDTELPRKSWGDEWRLPSYSEISELVNNCSWSTSTINGVSVFKVTGINGNYIYLPKTGWATYLKEYDYTGERQLTDNGYYWSSTLVQEGKWTMAYALTCQNGNGSINNTYNVDAIKMAIRPVKKVVKKEIPKCVDLGLPSGLLWATTNVGANRPEEYGMFFAWGETSPKSFYSWSTYKYANGSDTSLTKYNNSSTYGNVDYKNELDADDDAATVNLGEPWRTPTLEESQELINCCTWTTTIQNGTFGYKVTGPNGNYIFLPATGVKQYDSIFFTSRACIQTATTFCAAGNPSSASVLNCDGSPSYWYGWSRCWGYTVRPVTSLDPSDVESITREDNDDIIAIYDIHGHRISTIQDGINIVKYKNGKTKKLMR